MSRLFVRPVTLEWALLQRLKEVLEVGDKRRDDVQLRTKEVVKAWPVAAGQLHRLLLARDLVHQRHYEVLISQQGRRPIYATSTFLEELVKRGGLKERKQLPQRRAVNQPRYDYFVLSYGPFRDTVISLLKGCGEACENSDLVELNRGVGGTVEAWRIKPTTMMILYADNQLNPWRENLFFRRQQGDRGGRAKPVPADYFRKKQADILLNIMSGGLRTTKSGL